MKTNLSNLVLTAFLVATIFTITPLPTEASEIPQPTLGEDGLYRQSWFLESFLDIKEDMQTAKANGKRLVVFIEQKGCIYCNRNPG